MGIRDRPVAPRSPWQNGHAERLIGSIRRECLDHVAVFGEAHLRKLLASYATYYNEERTHLTLGKDAPLHRPAQTAGRVASIAWLGGLHGPRRADERRQHKTRQRTTEADSLGASLAEVRQCNVGVEPARNHVDRTVHCTQDLTQLLKVTLVPKMMPVAPLASSWVTRNSSRVPVKVICLAADTSTSASWRLKRQDYDRGEPRGGEHSRPRSTLASHASPFGSAFTLSGSVVYLW
jgi:integrase-like protein